MTSIENERRPVRTLLISSDDVVQVLDVVPDLASMQQVIGGGWLECLALAESPNVHAYFDEEGKLKGMEFNRLATAVVEHYRPGFSRHDVLVGDVMFLGDDGTGEEADCPQTLIDLVARIGSGG